jgi:hypothetical protein
VTVMGGPNVTQSPEWRTNFFDQVKCDYYVADAGEHPFNALVNAYHEKSCSEWRGSYLLHEHDDVHGIWYMDPNLGNAKI